MANTITLAEKFLPVVDDIYKSQSITACLDTNSSMDFTGANEVKILKVSTTLVTIQELTVILRATLLLLGKHYSLPRSVVRSLTLTVWTMKKLLVWFLVL